MFRTLNARSIALFAVLFSVAGISYGSAPARIVPAKGEKRSFSRTYSKSELNADHLRRITKTRLLLKNTKGFLTATWSATIRDVLTEKNNDFSSTGICKSIKAKKVECAFDASAGTVEITSTSRGARVEIPYGQGVLFTRRNGGMNYSEFFLGADYDESNTVFYLYAKKN